jgi:hypothetical protein
VSENLLAEVSADWTNPTGFSGHPKNRQFEPGLKREAIRELLQAAIPGALFEACVSVSRPAAAIPLSNRPTVAAILE